MIKIIAAILIIVPTLEIWGLTSAGKAFGWFPTLLMVILTGVVGAWLAKKEGLRVLRKAQIQLQQGQLPGEAILDGLCIFAGGLLLLTPGFFTDTIGFLLVFPYTRRIAKIFIKKWLWTQMQKGRFFVGFRKW